MRNMPTAPDKGLSGANHVAYFVASTRSRTTCRTSCQMCSTLLGRSWSVQFCCSPTPFPSPTTAITMADPQQRMTALLYLSILIQAYITICQRIVNENFTFFLYFTFSIPCGFLYKHVENPICHEKHKNQPAFYNV